MFHGKGENVFELDPRLAADTIPLGAFALSRVLLMNDARFPWLILVPARARLVEITDLDTVARSQLMEEICTAAETMSALFAPDKMNIGAIGNIVAQLHVHVVARRRGDAAWPGPVWGAGRAAPYEAAALDDIRGRLGQALPGLSREGAPTGSN
jgi:diadenosine tetraphosphate (Ap4A) HIT family hydrolase